MTTQAGDVLRFRFQQELLGQIVNNVVHYIVDLWTGNITLLEVLDHVGSAFITVAIPLQSDALTHTESRVDNITNEIDFSALIISIPGTITGNDMPTFVAGPYVKVVGTKVTRPGALRLPGITEGQVDVNDYAPAGPASLALAAYLAAEQNVNNGTGGLADLTPVIARIVIEGEVRTIITNPITDGAVGTKITTQNSRKFGVGI